MSWWPGRGPKIRKITQIRIFRNSSPGATKGPFDIISYKKIKPKIGKKVFIVEQAPFQTFNPKQIYYRSFNKDKTKFAKKLSHYSLHLDQHKKHQIFVKKTLNNFEIKYNNLILINLDDVFCENPSKKCLIGNEKYSFYIDESHLSTQGANLTRGKFTDIIEKF